MNTCRLNVIVQCCQFRGFPDQLGVFFRLIGRAIFAVAGCGFLGCFEACRGYWATAVLSGNQWSVDTANELSMGVNQ